MPSAVKIPLPEKFAGEMDHDKILTFLYGIDQNCNVVGLVD